MEINSLIGFANQWTGFHMIGTSVMNELIQGLSVNLSTISNLKYKFYQASLLCLRKG